MTKSPVLTARSLKALLRRLTKAEQRIILLQGDRNKLMRRVTTLELDVRDLYFKLGEILH